MYSKPNLSIKLVGYKQKRVIAKVAIFEFNADLTFFKKLLSCILFNFEHLVVKKMVIMKVQDLLTKGALCLLVLLAIDCLPAVAQVHRSRVTITKETYDEHGNKSVETIIKEGDEADDFNLEGEESDDSGIMWKHFGLDSLGMGGLFEMPFDQNLDIRMFFDSITKNFNGQGMPLEGPFLDFFKGDEDLSYKPKLGVKISELDTQAGVVVTQVLADTPADKAGLKEGDVILALNQEKVSVPQDLVDYIQTLRPEDDVIIDILRDGKHKELTATLTEYKPKRELDVRKI